MADARSMTKGRATQAKWLQLTIIAASLAAMPSAQSAESGDGDLVRRYQELRSSHDAQAREIAQLKQRMQQLESMFRGKGVIAQGPAPGITTQPPSPAQPASAAAAEPAGGGAVVKEAPRTRSVEGIYQAQGALFEQRFTIEPGLTYSRFDRRAITLSGFLALDAIFLGTINVQQTKSDLFTFDLTGRWGVTDRVQLDLNVPTLYRSSTFISGGVGGAAAVLSESKVSNGDLGDISVGASYQLWREAGSRPDLVLNARLKAPTGDHPYGIKIINPDPANNNLSVPERLPTGNGMWAGSLGVSALKTVDPAIVYGNIGVIHNFSRSFGDISPTRGAVVPGEVDLGTSFTWGAGLGFALNERMSMSLGVSQLISEAARTKPRGGSYAKIVGSEANAASFNVGLTFALSPRSTLVTNLGIGLTPDAPDFSVSVRLPYGL